STEESFGLSALEAMASGTAVLGTRVGGVPEVVTDGETGVLIDLDDDAAYVDALVELLGDRERSRTMGERARERAASEFERHAVVERYEILYLGVSDPTEPCF
ncbi:MAG: glycosyltransferase family 4 protein, partial [Planctomycetota bacterium]